MQKLVINDFLQQTLGLRLTNRTWAWDAYDDTSGTVVMKLWEDYHYRDEPERIEVYAPPPYKSPSTAGRNERRINIDRLIDGGETFAVIREGGSKEETHRRAYEPMLYRLGEVIKDEQGYEHALIIGKLTPSEFLSRGSSLQGDLADIETRHANKPTTRKALVDARIGQGDYKKALLALWGNQCAVTGCHLLEVVRASHAKPWRLSDDRERLDGNNGLPLIATLDILFDQGLIGFADDGSMMLSTALHQDYPALLALPAKLRRKPTEAQARYLAAHREHIFQGDTVS
ncbi:HNH endonuclease [Robbsia sp. Bb-Pol-6]|uniref:HNH endonuclease n=1 Tax=Robbsia betulipollinis TaxID=2981849 RepID=A0ABT3ZVJ4_9BURK|nr:HNH endonuclease [Robbsia betulipollinis]MCY0389915.1 HNH endonuclease [Robbsia betulipollinis]